MKSNIELMSRAFAVLESLPQNIAFDIVDRLERLSQFPKMGAPLGARFPKLKAYRQLVYKHSIRIIYEFDEYEDTIYVLAIQDCRQKLPALRDLKRDNTNGE